MMMLRRSGSDNSGGFAGRRRSVFERTSGDEIEALGAEGSNVNPYTVNDSATISLPTEIGVAGIITDYPQRGTR